MKKHVPFISILALALFPVAHAEEGANPLKVRQEKILNVVKRSGAAVVAIRGERVPVAGSGVVVSKDGLIMTAGHVLEPMRGQEFTIIFPDGHEVKAKPLGRNMTRDAALARIIPAGEYPFVELAAADSISEGSWCVAMGHPGGFEPGRSAPVRTGQLWRKDGDDFYRSDCAVSGGDSGGPLFDLEGKLIGIHSSIGPNISENRHIPAAAFQENWDRLKKGEVWGNLRQSLAELDSPRPRKLESGEESNRPKPTMLGARIVTQDGAVVVGEIVPQSPADGVLEPGDIVIKAGGDEISAGDELVRIVRGRNPGDKLELTVDRNGNEKKLTVILSQAP